MLRRCEAYSSNKRRATNSSTRGASLTTHRTARAAGGAPAPYWTRARSALTRALACATTACCSAPTVFFSNTKPANRPRPTVSERTAHHAWAWRRRRYMHAAACAFAAAAFAAFAAAAFAAAAIPRERTTSKYLPACLQCHCTPHHATQASSLGTWASLWLTM